jgi:long-chain fatty acid transport protein
LLLADVELTSTIGGATSATSGEAGVSPIPSVAWAHHVEGTPVTIGLGMFGIAGFRNNLPADPTNPVLAQSPLFADAEFLQIVPTISYALSECLSIGILPTVTMARLMLDPLGPSVVTPVPTAGSGNRVHWGGGAQIGIYYIASENWHTGFTIKSPQFFEEFRFFTPTASHVSIWTIR